MAAIGPNRQKNIVRIATELATKDANSLAPPQTAKKSATSGKQTSAKGGGASSTAPKQKSTPAVKTAGVSDSRGTASVGGQTQAMPKITASIQKTTAGGGGLTGGGTVRSLGSGTGTAIPQNRLTQLQRIERELENDYHFLKGFEQDLTGEKLYDEENWADQAMEALEGFRRWMSELAGQPQRTANSPKALSQGAETLGSLGGSSSLLAQASERMFSQANSGGKMSQLSQRARELEAAGGALDPNQYELKWMADQNLARLEQAERDVAEAQRHIYELEQFGSLTRGGETLTSGSFHSAPTQDDLKLAELKKQLEEASDRMARYEQMGIDLANLYYAVENQTQLGKLAQDTRLTKAYREAEELQKDLDTVRTLTGELAWMEGRRDSVWDETWAELDSQLAQLYQKYGYTGGKDQRGLAELTLHLRERQQPLVAALEQGGYNFDRLRVYEQTLRDAERYQQEQEKTARFAQEHPVLSSLASIAAVPYQAGEYIDTMTKGIGTNNERDVENYVPLNVYDMKFTNFVSGIREEVAGNIEESIDNEMVGKAASFLYQTGMSIGDSAYLITTLGPWASWVMAPNAASQQARDVILQGGSNSQAFWSGLAAGAAEKVFEKFGIDSLLGEKTVTGVKSLLKETAKQAGVEAGEEMLTEISNILTEAIMGDKSQYSQGVRYYLSQGMSEEEAKRKAFFDQLEQVGLAGLGGALSGGAMGGVVNTANYVSQRRNAASGPEAGYRAEKPKNVEFPTVPLINLSTQGFGAKGTSRNSLRKDAIIRARDRLGLNDNPAAYIPASNVTRNGDEYVLKITKASLNKMLSPANGGAFPLESIVVMDNLERIANNGVWFDSQADRKNRHQIQGIDHLKTTVYIDRAPYEVDMRVRLVQEKPGASQDNVLYYFTPEELVTIKKVGTASPTGERRALTVGSENVPTFSSTIAQSASEVNALQKKKDTD